MTLAEYLTSDAPVCIASALVEKAERSCFEKDATNEIAAARSSAKEREKIGNDMSIDERARSNPSTVRIDFPAALASRQRRTSSAGPLRKYLSTKATLQLSDAEMSISACPA